MTKRLSRGGGGRGKGERLEKQDVADERENFACDNYKYEYKYESEKDVRVRHGFGNLKIMRPDPRPVPFCRGSSTETTITYFALLRAPISYTR